MNPTTLAIAEVAGPLFLILGVAFLAQKAFYTELFKGLAKEKSFFLVDGIIETAVGLMMVLSHNVWTSAPEIVVSLLAWAVLLEGVLVLVMGKMYVKKLVGLFSKDMTAMVMWSGVLFLVLGGYLSYLGYLM